MDYSPFGVQLSGRNLYKTGVSKDHRFGFQGQEEDDEIKGEGNSLNYEYRMHDPRLGRFFAIDPLSDDYPWNSPYAFSENRVIDGIESKGESLELIISDQENDLFEWSINKPLLFVLSSDNDFSLGLFNSDFDDEIEENDGCGDEEPGIDLPEVEIFGGHQSTGLGMHRPLFIGVIVKAVVRYVPRAGKWVWKNVSKLWKASPKKLAKNPYLKKTGEQLAKDKKSYQKLLKQHKQKLKDFKKNPYKYDNKGTLKNAPKAQRSKIIKGRIKMLEKQINKHKGELKKIDKAIKTKS